MPDGKFVKQSTVDLYQEYIGNLISDLSRDVVIYQKPAETSCPWCIYDLVARKSSGIPESGYDWSTHSDYDGEARCPNCRGEGLIETASSDTVECTVRHLDKLSYTKNEIGYFKPGTIRLKCVLSDVITDDDLEGPTLFDTSVYLVVDGYYYEVVQPVQKGGLRDLYTVVVTAERTN